MRQGTDFSHLPPECAVLSDNNTVAFRKKGFADGITFSERPLLPGEVFMLEIAGNEAGWSGYMKLGLTQMDPSDRLPLPAFSKPHLVDADAGRAWWIFPVHNNMESTDQSRGRRRSGGMRRRQSIAGSSSSSSQEPSSSSASDTDSSPSECRFSEYSPEEVEQTFEELTLTARHWSSGQVLATDVGSQVGVQFRVNPDTGLADMHFILNGVDRGIKAASIPYNNAPLFAVVDVYGTTKKLRIVSESSNLQSACRQVILNRLSGNDVSLLPLPKRLKKFLRQKIASNESLHHT